MSRQRPADGFRPRLDSLEAREVPATLFTETFDALATPVIPAGWATWGNSTAAGFITTKLDADTGEVSLAALGNRTTASRFWNTTPVPADAGVSAAVRGLNPAPVGVVARGQALRDWNASFLAAVVQPTGRVDLLEVRGGVSKLLGSVAPSSATGFQWTRVTLQPVGLTATVRVQRLDTGAFLGADGKWTAAPTDALRSAVTWNPAQGFGGLTRLAGGTGMAYADSFAVTSPPAVAEAFDGTAAGTLPAGWKGYESAAGAGWKVATQVPYSAPNVLASNGPVSTAAARAWVDRPFAADVQASVAVRANTIIPAGVFVRGQNLDTAKPSYYALQVTRGTTVSLVRVVDGAATTLDTAKTAKWLEGAWIRATLTAVGSEIRGVVFRADTGEWLSEDGNWVNYPDAAVRVTDTAISAAGVAGVARERGYAGSVSVDDFLAQDAAAATGPGLTVSASQSGSVVGDVTFKATTGADNPARRIEFRVNGRLRAAVASASGEYVLDTTTLPNGAATVLVRALDGSGNASERTIAVTVANPDAPPAPVRPDLARSFGHIRIAQLAYSGTPINDFWKAKIASAVDLVIPETRNYAAVKAADPTVPILAYTNVSNLYLGLLTDWNAYADANGVNRESAFYHVSKATPFDNDSPSAQPVKYFWGVNRTAANGTLAADLTQQARGQFPTQVVFGGTGTSVNVGFVEKFRQIDWTLSKNAAAGWTGVLEYASKVDAAGNVTEWKALPTLSDGTNGLTASGRVLFDAPKDWVSGAAGTAAKGLFYVRVRTLTGTDAQAPTARTVFGRDYVGANGTTKGVMPAFDGAADKDGDGYLSDAEYAGRKAGFDARFVYESRLFYPNYGQMRFVTNPSAPAVKRWAVDYHQRLLASNADIDGIFIDNANGRLTTGSASVIEPTDGFTQDYAAMTEAVWRALSPKLVFNNTAGGWADGTTISEASTGGLEEFLIRPDQANWQSLENVAGLVAERLAAEGSPYQILDTYTATLSPTESRAKLGALAYYYLVADPDRTMIMFFGGEGPAADWSKTWIGAAEVDVGRPTGELYVAATGADPQNAALTYKVYAREYGNGLTIFKPLSYSSAGGTGTLADATATTHQLGGSYRVVNADGSLGAAVTQVTLRNGEGAVLVKA